MFIYAYILQWSSNKNTKLMLKMDNCFSSIYNISDDRNSFVAGAQRIFFLTQDHK
jgi:hypothetical protein